MTARRYLNKRPQAAQTKPCATRKGVPIERTTSHCLLTLASLLFCLAIAGCGKAVSSTAPVMVDSVNYMHERSVQYTLIDLSHTPPRAIAGSIVDRLASGGEKGCCIALPKTWRPQMKVRLDWAESDHDNTYEKHTRELEIPQYDAPADLYVVFYPEPKNDVELVVSSAEPGHADWRGRVKRTPWEQCLETFGRKRCKAAIPGQFDTKSNQGYCAWVNRNKRPDAEVNCAFATKQCMTDFEDPEFCKSILWEPRKE